MNLMTVVEFFGLVIVSLIGVLISGFVFIAIAHIFVRGWRLVRDQRDIQTIETTLEDGIESASPLGVVKKRLGIKDDDK